MALKWSFNFPDGIQFIFIFWPLANSQQKTWYKKYTILGENGKMKENKKRKQKHTKQQLYDEIMATLREDRTHYSWVTSRGPYL